MRASNRSRGRWSGQAALEFAVASLLFLGMLFGTIDLGRLVFMRTMFTNAVREASRQAAITPGSPSAIANAAAVRSPSLTLSESNFTITCWDWLNNARSCTSGSTSPPSVILGDQVRVCASYTFTAVATRIVGRSSIAVTECMNTHVH